MIKRYRGLTAAPGIGIGVLHVHRPTIPDMEHIAVVDAECGEHDADVEWQRFLHAQQTVYDDLQKAIQSHSGVAGDIFSVHQLILQDNTLLDAVYEAIRVNECSAITATYQTILDIANTFHALDDEYFSSRAADVVDIGRRLLARLGADMGDDSLSALPDNAVLVAADLTPTDVAQLAQHAVAGIALAESTPTAHSSILARSLGLPLVCALGSNLLLLETGQAAILDADQGLLIVRPDEETLSHYRTLRHELREVQRLADAHAGEPAFTCDGVAVPVYANANNAQEAVAITGADGIGLLRTEYLFQGRATPPAIDEQEAVFRSLALRHPGQVVTVRALDAGGDKPVDYLYHVGEENPFLGVRGIRLLLDHPELLQQQFQALVNAADSADVRQAQTRFRFMLPMISTLGEVLSTHELLAEILRTRHTSNPNCTPIDIGVLIEVPAAAILAEKLADHVDFFSIGTNDLAQYVLASDRTNSALAGLANPLHPAVLHLIAQVCRAGQNAGLPVSLCGEMGGDATTVPLLLGLGITELSVPLPAVPMVKHNVRRCRLERCRELAAAALNCTEAAAVRELLTKA